MKGKDVLAAFTPRRRPNSYCQLVQAPVVMGYGFVVSYAPHCKVLRGLATQPS